MECNIYAHHQIKTVFLYFLLGENGINSNLNVRFFSSSFPWLKQSLNYFYPSKGGCDESTAGLFSNWKGRFKKFFKQNKTYLHIYLYISSYREPSRCPFLKST